MKSAHQDQRGTRERKAGNGEGESFSVGPVPERVSALHAQRAEERTQVWPVADDAPLYVKACADERWYVALWPRVGGPAAGVKIIPFRCGSRRHPGPCRDFWAQRFYARIERGYMYSYAGPSALVTFTLPSVWHRRRSRSSILAANEHISSAFSKWTDSMNVSCVRAGLGRMSYVWAREDHKSGVPHVHMLLAHGVALECGAWVRGGVPAPMEWRRRGAAVGLGRIDASQVESADAVRKYISKVLSEVSKVSQRSLDGKLHRRDFGSTRGFLAPIDKSENLTGTLLNARGAPVCGAKSIPSVLPEDWVWTLDFASPATVSI